jgi:hypothetical protein
VRGQEEQLRQFLTWSVTNFSADRRAASVIRWFSENVPELLINVGIELLLDSEDTAGGRYLSVQLIKLPAFFKVMTDPWQYTVPQSVKLARRLLSVDRTLDIKLARCLPARNGSAGACTLEGPNAQRALEILDEISVGRRVVPVLNHLIRHPDVSISSKSTLLVGKRVQNLTWARRLLNDDIDPRVRANAIEAFWGIDSKPALQLFRASLKDPHNRVVGNSMMGLHLAGDSEVPRIVEQFASDYKPEFRMTTAWVMGKIGDPAYATPLGQLVKDAHPSVRSAALRSLKDLRTLERWHKEKEEAELALALPTAEPEPAEIVVPEPDQDFDPGIAIGLWVDGSKFSGEFGAERKRNKGSSWRF